MASSSIDSDGAQAGDGYFASISDLMVGILFVFLLMLTVFALNLRDTQQIELERYQQLQERANQLQEEARREKERAERERAEALRQQAEAARSAGEAHRLRERNETLRVKLGEATSRLQAEVRQREAAREDLLNRLADGLRARGVSFRIDQQSGVLRLSEDVPFETGRSDLTERTRRTTQILADVLSQTLPCFSNVNERRGCQSTDRPVLEAVFVEGHTDRQSFQNMTREQSQRENDRLSAARALTVFAELRKLQPSLEGLQNVAGQPLLAVSGYGERRPIPGALGDDERDLTLNRRIDIRFVLSARTSGDLQRFIDDIERMLRASR